MENSVVENNSIVIWPILVWLSIMILGIIYLVPFFQENKSEGITILVIILGIVERIATAIGTLNIVRKSGLNQNGWAIVAFFLGANQLLFLNIAIWIKSPENKEPVS